MRLGLDIFHTGDEDVERSRLVGAECGDCWLLSWIADYACELPGAGEDEGGEELGHFAVAAEEEDTRGHDGGGLNCRSTQRKRDSSPTRMGNDSKMVLMDESAEEEKIDNTQWRDKDGEI